MNQDLIRTVSALKNDPAIAAALARGDLQSLMNDPRLRAALQSMQNTTPDQQAQTLAKQLLETPSGARIKQMLEQL